MEGQTSDSILDRKLQRQLRNNPTDAEARLWRHLRNRNVSGAKFRRQHPFENYILDFVCFDPKIVIELDGGQHGSSVLYDQRRTAVLEKSGYVVLRFWNDEVLERTVAVMDVIWSTVVAKQAHPHPALPLKGRDKSEPHADV